MQNIWHNWRSKRNARAANSSSCFPKATWQQAFLLFRQTCCHKNNTFLFIVVNFPQLFLAKKKNHYFCN